MSLATYPEVELKELKIGSNVRTTLDATGADAELLASVASTGVLVPVLVRSVRGGLELVAGGRRYAAAKAAKLKTIPARNLGELSDLQVLEFQLVENLQRLDLDALDEAQGFFLLRENHGKSVEDIAALVHKKAGYVYGRLKLADVTAPVAKALRAHTIEPQHGLLLARIADPARQVKALEDVLRGQFNHVTGKNLAMSVRATQLYIEREFQKRLKGAPFDRKSITLVVEAGACTVCPFNSANEPPSLFGDKGGEDFCLKPSCYQAKLEASVQVGLARETAKGATALSAAEAAKAFQYRSAENPLGYVNLASAVPDHRAKKPKSWNQVVGKADVPVFTTSTPDGEVVRLVKTADAMAVARAAKEPWAANAMREESGRGARQESKVNQSRARALNQRGKDLLVEVQESKVSPKAKLVDVLRLLYVAVTRNTGSDARAKKHSPEGLAKAAISEVAEQHRHVDTWTSNKGYRPLFVEACKLAGVDAAKAQREVLAGLAAKSKQRGAKKAAATRKGRKPAAPKATEPDASENDVAGDEEE